MITLRHS